VTDETPATPQTGQESQTDQTSTGARLDQLDAARFAAPQRAATVTAPLARDIVSEPGNGVKLDSEQRNERGTHHRTD